MNARPVLSLVMPVYNVAQYLPACLDSLVAQTRQPDEIIAVDDGATDTSPQILAEYQSRLPQMRIIRQVNGGLSAARNTGMDHASGRWLVFLDSDDRLVPRHCEIALAMAESDDLDMALFNGWFDFEGREPDLLIYPKEPATEVMSGGQWLRERLERRSFFHMVWLHLYRRDFMLSSGLRFVPPWVHEDVQWTTRALIAARRVRYDPTPLVYYRKPVRRLAPGPATDARWRLMTESSAFNAQELDRIIQDIRDPELARMVAWQLVDGGLSIFHKLEKISAAETRRALRAKLRAAGIYGLLWRHASSWAQKRRIARNWLKSLA
ncbi:MAG: glycosyltransferase [Rhodocyclaceae bacterium]|nr:glycosyltransferase [Rhodocyclaceae bacterium]MBX3669579.1 glycosyltransferase [Rhodocyclaceae bacterium]